MMHVTIDGIAGERMPHGSPVRVAEGYAFRELDLAKAHAITKRPPQTSADHHEPGEPLKLLTDGGIMADVGAHPRWLVIRNGRIAR